MARSTYKCKYSHCMHESKDVPVNEAVKVGRNYYHEDCLKNKENVDRIISTFVEKVDSNVVMAVLRKTVNRIIFEQGNDSEFVLFALNIFADEKKIKYPGGIYYAIKDKDVIKKWNKAKSSEMRRETRDLFVITDEDFNSSSFNYTPKPRKNFASVLGGW